MQHLLSALLILLCALPVAASTVSPYAGQDARDIKTLSDAEISEYLSGGGMGLAKAAELNRYPGPRHVLDLADQLKLSTSQRKEVQAVFDSMRSQAQALGQRIVNAERELNHMFAERGVTYERLQHQVNEIARLQGELRYVHLRAHLATQALLTPHQTKQYNAMRGYHAGDGPQPHSH